MFSASFMPLQPGSWLMSIFCALGAVPSNLTVPLMVATVAGSMGVAAGCSAVGPAAGDSSFLLHAASTINPHRTSMLIIIPAQVVLLFMVSPFLYVVTTVGLVIPSEPERRIRPARGTCFSDVRILPRTSTGCSMFIHGRLFPLSSGTSDGRPRPWHGRSDPPLLFRC